MYLHLEIDMPLSTLSSRELNHDVSSAKKAAQNGPVIITDRGKPSHVLMTYYEYERLVGRPRSLIESLALPGLSDIDLSPERVEIGLRTVDLS
jgi:PHD/YefM family antitoxin component YafN of YafNO toxin-antitoxin module